MKDPDGRPASHDVTFLAETRICPRETADRLMRKAGTAAGATLARRLSQEATVSIHTEAIARHRLYNVSSAPWGST